MRRTLPRWILTALTVLAALALTACGGQLPPSTWPGLAPGDGVVYLTSVLKTYAINIADGSKKWEFEHKIQQGGLFGPSTVTNRTYATPAVGNGLVYVGTENGYLLALDATTGVEKCKFLPEQPGTFIPFIKEHSEPVFSGIALAGRRVLFAGTANKIYALDAATCRLEWTFEADSRVWGTPLAVGNTIYISELARKLVALEAETGRLRWTFDQPRGALAGAPAFDDGVVYVGSFDSHLYAVDAGTGDLRWSFNANNWVWEGPAVVSNTLYFGDVGGNVYALDASTQKLLWATPFQAEGAVRATPLYADGVLYVVTDKGALYALDAATGKERWPQPFKVPNARFLTTPLIRGELLLLAPLGTPTELYGLNPANGQTQWQFPVPTGK